MSRADWRPFIFYYHIYFHYRSYGCSKFKGYQTGSLRSPFRQCFANSWILVFNVSQPVIDECIRITCQDSCLGFRAFLIICKWTSWIWSLARHLMWFLQYDLDIYRGDVPAYNELWLVLSSTFIFQTAVVLAGSSHRFLCLVKYAIQLREFYVLHGSSRLENSCWHENPSTFECKSCH